MPADIGQRKLPDPVHNLPAADKALLLKMLDYDQSKRPEAADVVKQIEEILTQ